VNKSSWPVCHVYLYHNNWIYVALTSEVGKLKNLRSALASELKSNTVKNQTAGRPPRLAGYLLKKWLNDHGLLTTWPWTLSRIKKNATTPHHTLPSVLKHRDSRAQQIVKFWTTRKPGWEDILGRCQTALLEKLLRTSMAVGELGMVSTGSS